ncbi:SAM-dependent methyltransferase [Micromonospora sp. NPDC050200]|uniref:SAM-dependent methyltransferase n=1 Tax=Micromonospora sp. NPDC050200 TaxID=3155664 RepID=UPI0033EFD6A4
MSRTDSAATAFAQAPSLRRETQHAALCPVASALSFPAPVTTTLIRCLAAPSPSHRSNASNREPEEVRLDRASGWRVEDYLLGGAHNFAVDRAAAHQLLRQVPQVAADLRACRSFVARAVRHVAALGIRQFVVPGPPLPVPGGVHQVAADAAADARVVYVASDPVAVAFSRLTVADLGRESVALAGVDSLTDAIQAAAEVEAIDARESVCLVLAGLAPALTEQLEQSITAITRVLAAGSVLVVAHPNDVAIYAAIRFAAAPHTPFPAPTPVQRLHSGLDLLPPGLVPPDAWQPTEPTPQPATARWLAGVAVKRPRNASAHDHRFPITPCQEGSRDVRAG